MSPPEPDKRFALLSSFLRQPVHPLLILKHPNVHMQFIHHFPPVTIFRTLSKKLGIDAGAWDGCGDDASGAVEEE